MITNINEFKQKLNEEGGSGGQYVDYVETLQKQLRLNKTELGYYTVNNPGEGGSDSTTKIYFGDDNRGEGNFQAKDQKYYIVVDNSKKPVYTVKKLNDILYTSDSPKEVVKYVLGIDKLNENIQLPTTAICWEPPRVNELVTTNRDHYLVIVGNDVVDNGPFAKMQKLYDSIPVGIAINKYRSMYKLIAEDAWPSIP
jgi:hypothetical protein